MLPRKFSTYTYKTNYFLIWASLICSTLAPPTLMIFWKFLMLTSEVLNDTWCFFWPPGLALLYISLKTTFNIIQHFKFFATSKKSLWWARFFPPLMTSVTMAISAKLLFPQLMEAISKGNYSSLATISSLSNDIRLLVVPISVYIGSTFLLFLIWLLALTPLKNAYSAKLYSSFSEEHKMSFSDVMAMTTKKSEKLYPPYSKDT